MPAFYARVARDVVAHSQAAQVALADVLILVPNFHAVQHLNQQLVIASGRDVIIPPQVMTLPAWAQTVNLGSATLATSQRSAWLYQALKAQGWFDTALLWSMCDEIARLFDELTHQAVVLPLDADEFAAQLQAYYHTRQHQAVTFEARLVHDLWFALNQTADSPAAHYALQLAQLAERAKIPLFIVGLSSLSQLESGFLARYAERAPVHYFQLEDTPSLVAQVLGTAWPATLVTPLRQRALQLHQLIPVNPVASRLSYCAANSLEDEARAADTQIRLWLHEGKRNIAVVVHDRASARRLRALLERAQILVADETGWTLDTTTASAVVMRWVDALLTGFGYVDVLDLMKSPHLLLDLTDEQRLLAVHQLERALRNHGPVQGWARLLAILTADDDAARAALTAIQAAAALVHTQQPANLASWLTQLQRSLQALGVNQCLAHDAAGAALLDVLQQRHGELAADTGLFELAEFQRWLSRELANAAFVEADVDSPVIFTHLAATRLRLFDAALLLGADARNLPSLPQQGVFFNQSVRSALGLPTRAQVVAQMQTDLQQLLVTTASVQVLWQARSDGEANPISAWLERLDSLCQLAWGASLISERLHAQSAAAAVLSPDVAALPVPQPAPQPSMPHALIPQKISVSAYNALLACPYQYFARYMLGLNALDEVSAEVEKSDYGQVVHLILRHFHGQHASITQLGHEAAMAALIALSDAEFAPLLADDYFARAWHYRWLAQIPSYITWQIAREQEGWCWHQGEVDASRELALDGGFAITLRGRLDRIDKIGDDYAVLDYKTSAGKGLQDKASKDIEEDVQLSAYALLLDGDVVQTAFVSLDDGSVTTIDLMQEPEAAAASCATRLVAIFNQLYQAAPLPAQGIDNACQYCEMRGVCRRDYWVNAGE
ncbi:MAG: PD-(D/E)XK nuclease family protein [Sulfuriferula sp.]